MAPRHRQVHYYLALVAEAKGEAAKAIEEYRAEVANYPDDRDSDLTGEEANTIYGNAIGPQLFLRNSGPEVLFPVDPSFAAASLREAPEGPQRCTESAARAASGPFRRADSPTPGASPTWPTPGSG